MNVTACQEGSALGASSLLPLMAGSSASPPLPTARSTGLFRPTLPPGALPVMMGALGALVMPYNLCETQGGHSGYLVVVLCWWYIASS